MIHSQALEHGMQTCERKSDVINLLVLRICMLLHESVYVPGLSRF
jgi:hypothetical protein